MPLYEERQQKSCMRIRDIRLDYQDLKPLLCFLNLKAVIGSVRSVSVRPFANLLVKEAVRSHLKSSNK